MGWKLSINREHLLLWQRWMLWWVAFVGFMIVYGWRLHPRMDEILFVLVVPPIVVTGAYVAFCLATAACKVLWPVRLGAPAEGRHRLGQQSRAERNRRPSNRIPRV